MREQLSMLPLPPRNHANTVSQSGRRATMSKCSDSICLNLHVCPKSGQKYTNGHWCHVVIIMPSSALTMQRAVRTPDYAISKRMECQKPSQGAEFPSGVLIIRILGTIKGTLLGAPYFSETPH